MSPHETFAQLLRSDMPILALAPMQDVTNLAFWRVVSRYGGPDLYWTEYFRVHGSSRPDDWILESITANSTGRPVIAQMIGNDVEALVRTAKILQQHSVAAIDLNLGCPAPVVYRKCAGGGLLRETQRVDAIVGALRQSVTVPFTVKTRVGFDSPEVFDTLLEIFARHSVDLVTVHGRTVLQMYKPGVRYDLIAHAAAALNCPVLANGNVHSAEQASVVLRQTGARGLMIGRGAIRNPWLFEQIRQHRAAESISYPTGRDVLHYIEALWESQTSSDSPEQAQVQRLKKFMNFLGEGVRPADKFLFEIRRTQTRADFFRVCADYLGHDEPMRLEPIEVGATSTAPMAAPAALVPS